MLVLTQSPLITNPAIGRIVTMEDRHRQWNSVVPSVILEKILLHIPIEIEACDLISTMESKYTLCQMFKNPPSMLTLLHRGVAA